MQRDNIDDNDRKRSSPPSDMLFRLESLPSELVECIFYYLPSLLIVRFSMVNAAWKENTWKYTSAISLFELRGVLDQAHVLWVLDKLINVSPQRLRFLSFINSFNGNKEARSSVVSRIKQITSLRCIWIQCSPKTRATPVELDELLTEMFDLPPPTAKTAAGGDAFTFVTKSTPITSTTNEQLPPVGPLGSRLKRLVLQGLQLPLRRFSQLCDALRTLVDFALPLTKASQLTEDHIRCMLKIPRLHPSKIFYWSCVYGHGGLVDELMGQVKTLQIDINVAYRGLTPLIACSNHKNQSHIVERLLAKGADVSLAAQMDGWTALHNAARQGRTEVVTMLLAHKADPNFAVSECFSTGGWTPLHCAARAGSPECTKLLLAHGANPNVSSAIIGRTPLHLAMDTIRATAQHHIVRMLLEHGANVNCVSKHGIAPLMLAAQRGSSDDVIESLLKANAVVDEHVLSPGRMSSNNAEAFVTHGDTALHYVHTQRAAKMLLNAGADMYTVNERGWGVIHSLCDRGRVLPLRFLLEQMDLDSPEAFPNTKLSPSQANTVVAIDFRTPIFIAAQNGQNGCFKALVSHPKLRPDLWVTCYGLLPIEIAAMKIYNATMSELLKAAMLSDDAPKDFKMPDLTKEAIVSKLLAQASEPERNITCNNDNWAIGHYFTCKTCRSTSHICLRCSATCHQGHDLNYVKLGWEERCACGCCAAS